LAGGGARGYGRRWWRRADGGMAAAAGGNARARGEEAMLRADAAVRLRGAAAAAARLRQGGCG
jgi:hypothetical protein